MSPTWASTVQGLWTRVTGGSRPLNLSLTAGERSFELHAEDNQLSISASDGVSACVGIHRYLTEVCGVRVTWDTELPLAIDALPDSPKIRGQARVNEFYYLNFCTFSYSTAYWDWHEWEREIDWMALHGVTMPLNLVGHEAVLQLAYSRHGMTDEEIRTFLGGPGYLPFVYMGCLDSFAGPLSADWIQRHLELGRRILERERALGMTPVLPAFTGHLPRQLAPAGSPTRQWQGMTTTVLDPEDPLFPRLTGEIVATQQELFGTDHLYASDPFIEMIPAESKSPALVASAIVNGLRAADDAATWVLQSWPFSYQSDYWTTRRVTEFLDGIPLDAIVILDLWGEADPQWTRFDERQWVWNGLLNFGGRTEPLADLESANKNLETALASTHPPTGLGLTMEAIHNNPAFFELIADRAWTTTPSDVDSWVREFGRQRYGTTSPAIDKAWAALKTSVLNGRSASIYPERFISIAVSTPDYTRMLDPKIHDEIRAALFYKPDDLLSACRYLLEAGADNDLVLSCVALLLRVIDHRFSTDSSDFLEVFDDLDDLVATQPALRLDTWVAAARRWDAEDNARRIVTVWNTPDNPHLDNYSARIWSGLVSGYYKRRWELWLEFLPRALEPDGRAEAQSMLDTELRRLAEEFIAVGQEPRKVTGDARSMSIRVLEKYGDEFGMIAANERN